MGECLVVIHHPLDQHFNLATAFLLAKQPGRNDAGIVEDQQITGVHMGEQIRKLLMLNRSHSCMLCFFYRFFKQQLAMLRSHFVAFNFQFCQLLK